MSTQPLFNPNDLPNGTSIRLLITGTLAVGLCFWLSQQFVSTIKILQPIQIELTADLPLLMLSMVAILTIAFYLFHPTLQLAFFGASQEIFLGHPLFDEVDRLASDMGVRVKHIYMDSNIRNADAIAFGLLRSKRLALGRGIYFLLIKRPEQARARLAHELGHLRNGDVDRGFLELSMVRSIVFLAVFSIFYVLCATITPRLTLFAEGFQKGNFSALLATLSISHGGLRAAISFIIGTGLWSVFLYTAHRAFLREREFLADAEAVTWSSPSTLVSTLTSVQPNTPSPALSAQRHKLFLEHLRSFTSAHPRISERKRNAAHYTYAGFPRPGLFFFLGFALSIVDSLDSYAMLTPPSTMLNVPSELSITQAAEWFASSLATVASSAIDTIKTLYTFAGEFLTGIFLFSVCLRLTLQARLNKMKPLVLLVHCLLCLAMFTIGYVFGDRFSPFLPMEIQHSSLWEVLLSPVNSDLVLSRWTLWLCAFFPAAILLAAVLARGRRPVGRSVGLWLAISGFWSAFFGQALTIVVAIRHSGSALAPEIMIGMVSGMLIYLVLATAITLYARKRRFEPVHAHD